MHDIHINTHRYTYERIRTNVVKLARCETEAGVRAGVFRRYVSVSVSDCCQLPCAMCALNGEPTMHGRCRLGWNAHAHAHQSPRHVNCTLTHTAAAGISKMLSRFTIAVMNLRACATSRGVRHRLPAGHRGNLIVPAPLPPSPPSSRASYVLVVASQQSVIDNCDCKHACRQVNKSCGRQ